MEFRVNQPQLDVLLVSSAAFLNLCDPHWGYYDGVGRPVWNHGEGYLSLGGRQRMILRDREIQRLEAEFYMAAKRPKVL